MVSEPLYKPQWDTVANYSILLLSYAICTVHIIQLYRLVLYYLVLYNCKLFLQCVDHCKCLLNTYNVCYVCLIITVIHGFMPEWYDCHCIPTLSTTDPRQRPLDTRVCSATATQRAQLSLYTHATIEWHVCICINVCSLRHDYDHFCCAYSPTDMVPEWPLDANCVPEK